MTERPLHQGETRGASPYFVLTVTWAGREHRWATGPVDITKDDGSTISVEHVCDVQVADRLAAFGGGGITQVTFSGLFLDDDVDVALEFERGNDLEYSPAELSLWYSGRTWEQRRVLLVGEVRNADYDVKGAPIAIDVETRGYVDTSVYPPPEARVTSDTWPSASDRDAGRYYPIVIGKPGFSLGATVTGINAGGPALFVDSGNDLLVVSDGWVKATSVQIIDATQDKASSFSVVKTTDGLGRKVSTVTTSVGYITDGDEILVRWNETNGGITNDDGELLRGAGDVCLWALRNSSVPYDLGRWRAVADRLNDFKIDTYIDEPVSLYDWLDQHVLPLLPISVQEGPSGKYPILIDHNATKADARADLTAGEGLVRDGPVQVDRGGLANEFRIAYAPRSDDGKPYYHRTLTGRDVLGSDRDSTVRPSAILRASRAKYGVKDSEGVIESKVIYDHATAVRVLQWKAGWYAYPQRRASYRDTAGEWAWLNPGDVVTITDSDRHWTDKVAHVLGLEQDNGDMLIDLLLLHNPARDTRPSS